MNLRILFLVLILSLLNSQKAIAEENEYGIVKAWFNEKNATLETLQGVLLKVGEPVEIKVEVISKINGNMFVEIREPGVTMAFNTVNGPSKIGEFIDNYDIIPGWSKTYTWLVTPNGAWKNGNAPINVFVQFSKIENGRKKGDKEIEFTIANPYILDEQYAGAAPQPTGTVPGATPKAAPFPSAVGAIAMLIAVWAWRRLH